MKKLLLVNVLVITTVVSVIAQTANRYEISFPEAEHHLANVSVEFPALSLQTLTVRMSVSSPGRYAIHEFAKNVFDVHAFNEKGEELEISRPDQYSWSIGGHKGYVKLTYRLFANRGDGTYSQVDATHAHLNMPATFMFSEQYAFRPIEIRFNVRKDLNWKVATQLKPLNDGSFYAPDLQYFMDSPTEISDFMLREWQAGPEGRKQTIRLALHHRGTEAEADEYAKRAARIVETEEKIFGELPEFDYGTYTFLACYLPNVSGDGMEHRNSTILTTTRSLASGGMDRNLGTVSHEFFHCWNVERIRPAALEPFDFTRANMSGELWFAEGFTSYYTNLVLVRAGLMTPEDYVEGLSRGINAVANSPARQFRNPIEMSYRAPFVDAASSIDPTFWENTFISYYTYGSVLGLALDLSLREQGKNLTLDAFMQQMWKTFGKNQRGYTVKDIENTLMAYAGKEFASDFFGKYIYSSETPDFKSLLGTVGIEWHIDEQSPYTGMYLYSNRFGQPEVGTHPMIDSPAWKAGLQKGDQVLEVIGSDGQAHKIESNSDFLDMLKPGVECTLKVNRFGEELQFTLLAEKGKDGKAELEQKVSRDVRKKREAWLKIE